MYKLFSKGKQKNTIIDVTLTIGPVPGTEGGEPKAIISALNVTEKPVILTGPGILLPKKRHVILPMPLGRVRFPYEIQPGDDCCCWTDAKILAQQLYSRGYKDGCRIIGYYSSGFAFTATSFNSEPIDFDVMAFLKGEI